MKLGNETLDVAARLAAQVTIARHAAKIMSGHKACKLSYEECGGIKITQTKN